MVDRTRNDILNAFNHLIRKNSIEKITVEKLIHEAGISKATFYRYFTDKYDVMNYNYKLLLDKYSTPGNSTGYRDLYEKLYKHGIKNWKFLLRAFETVGKNSFCEFIETYSRELINQITRQNRNGAGLTDVEELQCDVFCIGVSYMYRNWIFEKYPLSPEEASQALYDIMPKTLRDYWWDYK
jgi:AcrR family transcriptional regulator